MRAIKPRDILRTGGAALAVGAVGVGITAMVVGDLQTRDQNIRSHRTELCSTYAPQNAASLKARGLAPTSEEMNRHDVVTLSCGTFVAYVPTRVVDEFKG